MFIQTEPTPNPATLKFLPGRAVLKVIREEGLQDNARTVGAALRERLEDLKTRFPMIGDVRGKGLMLAAELDSADLGKLVVAEMLKRRILINCTSDTVLRFLPPYILKREHVDTAVSALDEILTEHASGAATPSAAQAAGGNTRGH